jgi:hypothetical protein
MAALCVFVGNQVMCGVELICNYGVWVCCMGMLACGDGLTAVKMRIFVFRRAARIRSEFVLMNMNI